MAAPRSRTVTPRGGTILADGSAPSTRTQGSPGSHSSPSLSFEAAIQQYQAQTPYGPNAYEGLFPYLEGLGFKVERPTRAHGLLSDDKIVDSQTGRVFDVILDVGGPNQKWALGGAGFWFDGAPSETGRGLTGTSTGRTATGRTMLGSETTSASAAAAAARHQRQQSGSGGRQSTILGGFKRAGAPTTRPTMLGGY